MMAGGLALPILVFFRRCSVAAFSLLVLIVVAAATAFAPSSLVAKPAETSLGRARAAVAVPRTAIRALLQVLPPPLRCAVPSAFVARLLRVRS